MTSGFDMTTLDDEHRMTAYVVVSDMDPRKIKIHDDSNIEEIRAQIASVLKVPVESQAKLRCTENDGEPCNVELTREDEESNKKLNEYDPAIVANATFTLEVTEDFDISQVDGKRSAPRKAAPRALDEDDSRMRPTSIQGEREQEKRRAKERKQQQRQERKMKTPQTAAPTAPVDIAQGRQGQQGPRDTKAYRPSNQEKALYHIIQKHSRTHCRLLFVLMEIQLILLIVYWGGLDMILYLIAIMFCLAGFRGCRKLHPLWILAFLLWLLLEILLILLFIIAGIVEGHESIYGSTAAYISLLCFELILDVTWAYFYFKFLRMVLSMDYKFRAWGELQMKNSVVFC